MSRLANPDDPSSARRADRGCGGPPPSSRNARWAERGDGGSAGKACSRSQGEQGSARDARWASAGDGRSCRKSDPTGWGDPCRCQDARSAIRSVGRIYPRPGCGSAAWGMAATGLGRTSAVPPVDGTGAGTSTATVPLRTDVPLAPTPSTTARALVPSAAPYRSCRHRPQGPHDSTQSFCYAPSMAPGAEWTFEEFCRVYCHPEEPLATLATELGRSEGALAGQCACSPR
jgi:hypothetical protein